jgi:hypothetical protein
MEKRTEVTIPKQRKSRLAIVSLILALSAWVLFSWSALTSTRYDGFESSLLTYLLLSSVPLWLLALLLGVGALRQIRRKKTALEGKTAAKVSVLLSAVPLVVLVLIPLLAITLLTYSSRLHNCDPVPVMAMIEKGFRFQFPEKVEAVKAAEADDRGYSFILKFTTDQVGWKQFQDSLLGTIPHELSDAFGFEDCEGGLDPRGEFKFFSLYTHSIPRWYRTRIRKGTYYVGQVYSENKMVKIDTICADTADPQKVVVYIEGWGQYYVGYGLHYINPENPNVVPDNPKSVRWLLDRFTEKMKVKYPDDTTLINAKQLCALYGHAYLKIKIERTSLKEFVESSPFSDKPLHDEKRFCNNDPELAWWDPEKPKTYKSGEIKLSDIELLKILIDLDEPNTAVIYLEWLEI